MTKQLNTIKLIFLSLAALIWSTTIVSGQERYKLTLAEAVQFAKSQNKWVQAAGIEENAAVEDRKDVYNAALPTVNVSGSYQRFSDLTLFTGGLSHSTIRAQENFDISSLPEDAFEEINSIQTRQRFNEVVKTGVPGFIARVNPS